MEAMSKQHRDFPGVFLPREARFQKCLERGLYQSSCGEALNELRCTVAESRCRECMNFLKSQNLVLELEIIFAA